MSYDKDKIILVTGGAGFIGTNFVRHVLGSRKHWQIVNLDALTYAGNLANFDQLPAVEGDRHHFIHGDIRDAELLSRLFRRWDIDGVIHFAAESHVDRSIFGPEAFLETNVLGTFRLLDVSRTVWENKGKPDHFRFLHVSTDEVYGSLGPDGYFTEATPYDPSSPYSASKAASDHFVKAYYKTYGLPTVVTNCSNNYGPFQFPEKLIPLVILNILEQRHLPVYGDGKNVRDWIYVLDHCDAILQVFEDGEPGETYNIGGSQEKRNIDIVCLLCDIMDGRMGRPRRGQNRGLIRFVGDRPGHDRRYAIDSTKIRKELGWSPRHRFEEALETTVDWYLNHMEWVERIRSGEYRKWIEINYEQRDQRSSEALLQSIQGG
jgi:dTDP-glucose 4,6-dehydratase